jgi:hypothetical protein
VNREPFFARCELLGGTGLDFTAVVDVPSSVVSRSPVRFDGVLSREQRLPVTVALHCNECRQPWNDLADRWRIYLTADDPPLAFTYCRRCARREFGD